MDKELTFWQVTSLDKHFKTSHDNISDDRFKAFFGKTLKIVRYTKLNPPLQNAKYRKRRGTKKQGEDQSVPPFVFGFPYLLPIHILPIARRSPARRREYVNRVEPWHSNGSAYKHGARIAKQICAFLFK